MPMTEQIEFVAIVRDSKTTGTSRHRRITIPANIGGPQAGDRVHVVVQKLGEEIPSAD